MSEDGFRAFVLAFGNRAEIGREMPMTNLSRKTRTMGVLGNRRHHSFSIVSVSATTGAVIG
ncbi:MAG: hypothetical protein QOI15_879 [Pseudonocardiales bacterium]|nr:hypothetical protein [Pseudonocardiales bacterium]